ncbi:hypothetical protein KL86DPRO_60096 [uncultured delta proteobacterium]|uniref:Uncharacterized protein n=1 Tax=uncultured delta proteobacterium TaxID=34034 RepID=A0A212KF11_9DELT|nr:hypothetical protein KL86DPRO_60095 [uncultured delta proteobacterium]SBW10262.1 hypothetical protein KL86DPRO_60096 [uncultured delta proteobacterium]
MWVRVPPSAPKFSSLLGSFIFLKKFAHYLEGLMAARLCGFESHLAHQNLAPYWGALFF